MKFTLHSILGAVCLAIGVLGSQSTASAVAITGSLAFGGSATPQNALNQTTPDLRNATQIAFGTTFVTGVSGTFASFVTPFISPVTMAPLLKFASPQNVPLNPFYTVGGFTFALNTINVGPDPTTATTLSLSGRGTFTGNGFDATQGTYQLQIGTQGGVVFSFQANSMAIPDGGTTVALLGLGLVAIEIGRRTLSSRLVKI